jgi:flagella basal body P-ring formation protein FlgA
MGQTVAVTLICGDLTMITSAEARSNGAMGQLIKVMNLDSKREFTARVVGPERVEVKLEE